MVSTTVWLISLLLCWGIPSPCSHLSYAAVYYVTPHLPNPNCPSGEPCLTINEFAQGNHFDGDDNITLLFLSGEHNLTAQNFEIANKTLLVITPSQSSTEIVIQLLKEKNIIVRNVLELDFTRLKLISLADSVQPVSGVFFSNIDALSVTRIRTKFCQLSIHGKTKATITELGTTRSIVTLIPIHNSQTITIRNSDFHHSTLIIKDIHTTDSIVNSANTLNFESSIVYNSTMTVDLPTQILYNLSILNSSISSTNTERGTDTGIYADIQSTTLFSALVKDCKITGNDYGIVITVGENSSVDLTVDSCFIANNGHRNLSAGLGSHMRYGGIDVSSLSNNTVVTVKIVSSILSGNTNSQISIRGIAKSKSVSFLNSTIRGTHSGTASQPCNHEHKIRNQSVIWSGAYFTDYIDGDNSTHEYICEFLFINLTRNLIEGNSIGVGVYSLTCRTYEIHFRNNLVTHQNNGFGLVVLAVTVGVVSVEDSLFAHNQGSAAAICICIGSAVVNITETTIAQNGNGIIVAPLHHSTHTNLTMAIENCQVHENVGVSIGVLIPRVGSDVTNSDNIIILRNVTLFKNTNVLPNSGIVQMDGTVALSVEDSCVFKANYGSSIHAFTTIVTLSGDVLFVDNIAFEGGAISLRSSKLTFMSVNKVSTRITFVNNSALNVGGAIFIDQSLNIDTNSGSSCFYDLQGATKDELRKSIITLAFKDNAASIGGTDIYGATPNSECKFSGRMNNNGPFQFVAFVSEVWHYVFKTSTNFSSVTSDPKRVCLCDSASQLMCANLSHIFHNTTRYPGEVFSLPLAVVGFEFGTVTGPVYAKILPWTNNSTAYLEKNQALRQVGYNGCTSLNFTVYSLESMETIVLKTNITRVTKADNPSQIYGILNSYFEDPDHVIPFPLLFLPVYIDVILLRCPSGFQINSTSKGCECSDALKLIGVIDCKLYNSISYITRSDSQWVKQVFNPDGILSSQFCPYGYCTKDTMRVNLNDSDKQCIPNRTGILCGACPPTLSLAIGSSRCLECSNNYGLSLLIAFAAAGIVLVLFIKILDLTVSKGTINGLIFYANIVWANQSVLFPPPEQTSALLRFLKVFIAWLNLDLGIEICFIQQLDGYWKAWLQFVFPAYIWLIAGLIIFVSHYSTRATKIFGINSLSVLATLFLISYAKLLRTILSVLEFTLLNTPNGQKIVWAFDGNVDYFSPKHSVLFVLTVMILLIFWLPYTFVLLFIQCLRRYSDYSLLRWVNKLHPLFDSYLGPLKDKHQYWIGLGLFARLVVLLTSILTMSTEPFIAAVVINGVASLFGLLVFNVYKQWQLSVLEGCSLVNMAIFSSGAYREEKDSLACVSLGIAFFLFLVIAGYHTWKKCQLLKKSQHREGYEDIDNIQQTLPPQRFGLWQSTTYQEISAPNLRESLLESVTD